MTQDQELQTAGSTLAMVFMNIAWASENYHEDCKGTGLTPDRYECPCRKNAPFSTKEIDDVSSGLIELNH